jgi:hypothetical protein
MSSQLKKIILNVKRQQRYIHFRYTAVPMGERTLKCNFATSNLARAKLLFNLRAETIYGEIFTFSNKSLPTSNFLDFIFIKTSLKLQSLCSANFTAQKLNKFIKSETSGSHSCEYEDGCLLGCCAVWCGTSLPTFQSCLLPPSSGRSPV